MRKYALLIALFSAPLIGCMPPLNDGGPGGGGGADGGGTHNPGADGGGTQGAVDMAGAMSAASTITSDTTWSGLVNVPASVTIKSGATLTISAGALVSLAVGADIHIQGSLIAQGTSASPVVFQSVQQGMTWGSLLTESGGSIDLTYAHINYANIPISCASGTVKCTADHSTLQNFSGQGMQIASDATFTYMDVELGGSDGISFQGAAGQTVTITDSTFHATGGDAIVADGAGNLTFQYNHVYGNGDGTAQTPTGQHCACHFDSSGTFIIDHNLFEKSSVGFMASQMNALSKVNLNNFETNAAVSSPASNATINAKADLSNNYWGSKTCPASINGNTTSANCSPTELSPTGPRP